MILVPATLFVVASVMELSGVWLVVRDVRDSRHRWDAYQTDRGHEREAVKADPALVLDPMATRHGLHPWRLIRALDAVEALIAIN